MLPSFLLCFSLKWFKKISQGSLLTIEFAGNEKDHFEKKKNLSGQGRLTERDGSVQFTSSLRLLVL
jgi:hypothetical protein